MKTHTTTSICLLAALALGGCGEEPAPKRGAGAPTVTNRIEVPPEVVENLGITFAKAVRGRVRETLTVHGIVRVAADKRWRAVAPADGRIRLTVRPWQQVARGEALGTLTSTALAAAREALLAAHDDLLSADVARREIETAGPFLARQASALAESADAARAQVRAATAALASGKAMRDEAGERVARFEGLHRDGAASPGELLAARRDLLEAASGAAAAERGSAQAEVDAARLDEQAAVARVRAETHAERLALAIRRVELTRLDVEERLSDLAALAGVPEETLRTGQDGRPGWMAVRAITIRAPGDGVVVGLPAADGEWVSAGEALVDVEQCTALVFEGHVPEGDLARIPADAVTRVRMPSGVAIEGLVARVLPAADPVTRTARVLVALPEGTAAVTGTSADADLVIGVGAYDEVLVPRGAVVRDALEQIVFKRDPADPHQVIRTPVSIGRISRDEVEILAGVGAGDELVVSGVHQLKQTGLGKAAAGGHFHADGTFHVGED